MKIESQKKDTLWPAGPYDSHVGVVWKFCTFRAEIGSTVLSDEDKQAVAQLFAASPDMYEALEPFANIDGEGADDFPDDAPVTITFGRTTYYAAKLGDFRRARAALKKAKEGQ